MSYSEGPWSVEANAYGTIFVYGSKTYGTPSGFRYRELICGGDSYKTLTPDNASLIGAGPDLIEALQEARVQVALLQGMRGIVDTGHGTLSIIDAALQKAGVKVETGEEVA